ncbi:hypothetical protein FKM82_023877 [Ascaphus truei]
MHNPLLARDLHKGQGLIPTLASEPTLQPLQGSVKWTVSPFTGSRINTQPASCPTLHPLKGPSNELYLSTAIPIYHRHEQHTST